MTARVTPLGLSLLTVAAWALPLAVLAASAELLLAALPLVLAVATLGRRGSGPDYTVAARVSSDRLLEGEGVEVSIVVTAGAAAALMLVRGPVPADTTIVSGRPRAAMALGRGQSSELRYMVRCPARGAYDFGAVVVQVRDRFGMRAWERHHVERRVVHVHPRSTPLRSLPKPLHTQTSTGDYVSRALGEGLEPGDIRQFAPGDQVRQVHWRASLRLGRLYVTQHHREHNADVVLMLDTLAEVGARSATTLDLGVQAATSLALAYLARKDRVGLITYGGTIDWVRPGSGRAQYERMTGTLLRAAVVFTYVTKDLAFVPPRILPARALLVAITPLLDPRFTKAALDLAARGFNVVVVVVSPVEVMRAALPPTPLNDLACRLWELERRARLDDFRRHGLAVFEWNPSQPLEHALAGLARRRPRGVAG